MSLNVRKSTQMFAPSDDSDQTFWIAKDAKLLQTDKQDSDKSARWRRLICQRWAHMSEGIFSTIAVYIISTHHENIPI